MTYYYNDKQHQNQREVIGLLPAGGRATRISPLPLSKELYPIGLQTIGDEFKGDESNLRPKVVSHYLLEKMRSSGINKAYFILRPGKWDIPAYFGDGEMLSMSLGYLIMNLPYGVPFTLEQAYPFVRNAVVALGFPDILFQPEDAFVKILSRLDSSNADIVLGLFPCDQPQKAGMVDFDDMGKVCKIIEKVKECNLRYMWGMAVWTPKFTDFLHEYVQNLKIQENLSQLPEVRLSDVIQEGINQGLRVEAEVLPDAHYIDIGTPSDLIQALKGMGNLT
ncbi:MAG: dTDP-glucose pyrophosphorylase [Calothrix sp. SM1_7_51]|nr:dTDP-glucose pyrophosphorylase [Calothrix sp. SM1_7_51]